MKDDDAPWLAMCSNHLDVTVCLTVRMPDVYPGDLARMSFNLGRDFRMKHRVQRIFSWHAMLISTIRELDSPNKTVAHKAATIRACYVLAIPKLLSDESPPPSPRLVCYFSI